MASIFLLILFAPSSQVAGTPTREQLDAAKAIIERLDGDVEEEVDRYNRKIVWFRLPNMTDADLKKLPRSPLNNCCSTQHTMLHLW